MLWLSGLIVEACGREMTGRSILVELCAGGIDDVLVGAAAAVDRIELNSGMALGGLTPSMGLVRNARTAYRGPLVAMVRPREGGFCYSNAEFLMMLDDAECLLSAGVDGLACGFLRSDGTVDIKRCRKVRAVFPRTQLVFHRAFDAVADRIPAMEHIIDCGFDRILTSGGAPTAMSGATEIRRLMEAAGDRIEILPCGKIRSTNVSSVIRHTGCRQIHTAVRETARDSSTTFTEHVDSGSEETRADVYGRVSHEELKDLLQEVAMISQPM